MSLSSSGERADIWRAEGGRPTTSGTLDYPFWETAYPIGYSGALSASLD